MYETAIHNTFDFQNGKDWKLLSYSTFSSTYSPHGAVNDVKV